LKAVRANAVEAQRRFGGRYEVKVLDVCREVAPHIAERCPAMFERTTAELVATARAADGGSLAKRAKLLELTRTVVASLREDEDEPIWWWDCRRDGHVETVAQVYVEAKTPTSGVQLVDVPQCRRCGLGRDYWR
jgi:hypothetical protein